MTRTAGVPQGQRGAQAGRRRNIAVGLRPSGATPTFSSPRHIIPLTDEVPERLPGTFGLRGRHFIHPWALCSLHSTLTTGGKLHSTKGPATSSRCRNLTDTYIAFDTHKLLDPNRSPSPGFQEPPLCHLKPLCPDTRASPVCVSVSGSPHSTRFLCPDICSNVLS